MNKFYHSVRLEESLCTGCINCIKRCPTQAIRVRNGKARINNKFCIDCGECIRVCPHHAKLAVHDLLDALENYEYTVALPAPSLYGQFNNLEDVNIVLDALLQIGFDDVYEVSAAAELVSEATRAYLAVHEDNLPLISTACPCIVRLIRVRFPNLITHLLPFKPPVEVAACLAAKAAMEKTGLPREKIGICFISPCPSKVTYARAPLGIEKSEIDLVFAIKDIYPRLLSKMDTVRENPRELSASGRIGISWGRTGGEAGGLLTENYLAADGIENAIQVLEDLEDQKFSDLRFVELNACSGGCVGGVFTVENPYVAAVKLKRLRKYMPISRSRLDSTAGTRGLIPWSRPVEFEPVFSLGSNMLESFTRLGEVERLCRIFPALDCGSCGAPTCKALAEDIVRGHASERDCVYYLRENLHRLSEEISLLADDLHAGNATSQETLFSLQEYIRVISNEMSKLDDHDDRED